MFALREIDYSQISPIIQKLLIKVFLVIISWEQFFLGIWTVQTSFGYFY